MYEIIKKQNGEGFARVIRNYDNGILDVPNIDKIVRYAGRDAGPIIQYLVSLKGVKIQQKSVHHDPISLLDKAGYSAYVADSQEKQNAIKSYFAKGEELCTFSDPVRYKKYYIINAVRKDVNNIKRGDFKKPEREDAYGTSVLSIQIPKTGGAITIKNRYNHTVRNPDNTFGSNPDNIIEGLSDALRHKFDVDFSSQGTGLPEKYILVGNQICKYETKINNIYCAKDFYIKNDRIFNLDKNYEKMLEDGILLNLKTKKVSDVIFGGCGSFDSFSGMRNCFVASLNKAVSNKKLRVLKRLRGCYDVFADDIRILTVKNGSIVNINIPDAFAIRLKNNQDLYDVLNFEHVKRLELINCKLSDVSKIIMPRKADMITLGSVQLPECDLNLSTVKELRVLNADLSRIKTFVMPQNTNILYFDNVVFPKTNLDFAGYKSVKISGDLSLVKKITATQEIDSMILKDIVFSECEIDLTGVKNLDIINCDMSRVRKLKLPLSYQIKHDMIKLFQDGKTKIEYIKNQNYFIKR